MFNKNELFEIIEYLDNGIVKIKYFNNDENISDMFMKIMNRKVLKT